MVENIKKLRKITGLGITDCKNALIANDQDIEKSIEYLRKNGLKLAAGRENKETAHGMIYAHISEDKKIGVLVELKCETDFVADMDDFKEVAKQVAFEAINISALSGDIHRELKERTLNGIELYNYFKKTTEMVNEFIARTKENIVIGRIEKFQI